jgi:hypothetical protein
VKRDKKDSGYQYLDNSFWDLCKERNIYRLPQHLYIYLRGRYCKYGPEFDWADAEIRKLLGVGRNTLRRAKKYLRERGLIRYKNGRGSKWTHYIMLASVLLPNIKRVRGSKNDPLRVQNHPSKGPKWTLSAPFSRQSSKPLVINKVKNKVSVSHNKKKFKKFNPNSKESLKYKERLNKILKNGEETRSSQH